MRHKARYNPRCLYRFSSHSTPETEVPLMSDLLFSTRGYHGFQ